MTEETKELTAQESQAKFLTLLKGHVESFEKLVNNLPTTESAILFCGAVEGISKDFKNIFLESHRKELIAEGKLSHSQVKKALVRIDDASASILMARHTPMTGTE